MSKHHGALIVLPQQSARHALVHQCFGLDTEQRPDEPRFHAAWHNADHLKHFAFTRCQSRQARPDGIAYRIWYTPLFRLAACQKFGDEKGIALRNAIEIGGAAARLLSQHRHRFGRQRLKRNAGDRCGRKIAEDMRQGMIGADFIAAQTEH
ncbi:hypothetical protein AJ87_23935 [Rhizobium yanglingense]|nr:hypothetical protein AJ87_23935 [Rhizobium yanglingense]